MMTEDPQPENPDEGAPPDRRRALLIGGGALIVVALVLGVWALWPAQSDSRAEETPTATSSASASATPVATAEPSRSATAEPDVTESPTEEPEGSGDDTSNPDEPDAATAIIDSFRVSTETALCADDRASTVPLTFTWSTTDAVTAWIASGTNDASAQPFDEVPLNSSGYTELAYECFMEEQLFTLTVKGDGGTTSSSISIVRELD